MRADPFPVVLLSAGAVGAVAAALAGRFDGAIADLDRTAELVGRIELGMRPRPTDLL
ncbi:hypothetical protein [Cryptosporangium aurantiacum]|uniref:Uncharacterized protein n=1 Tax=Cryptosporangium aurantiacum TaxID=134849 RepID=A0A1M7RLN8_9ACTN|nr:hypothetical protein [Cryptosporangium aurantiacum]SHN47008.1 hypothetical protein SAMN05443668_119104 [Cryptosporangium aurantiacum]